MAVMIVDFQIVNMNTFYNGDDVGDGHDCKACYALLTKVDTKLENLNKSIMKILYALLGVIGANIGTKYIGTPLHVELAMYSLFFASIFVLTITLAKFRCLNFWEKWIRFSFVGLCFWVTGLRIYHYQTATSFTQNEGIVTQAITISMAIGFIVLAWKRDAMRKAKRRRWDDK